MLDILVRIAAAVLAMASRAFPVWAEPRYRCIKRISQVCAQMIKITCLRLHHTRRLTARYSFSGNECDRVACSPQC